tara:strand:- start:680 stop:1087 length:408 start_codon:yes stop_codon:yes gene_type:complete
MTATYDSSNLDPATTTGKINVVRFLLGDTDVSSPEVQDEEITFSLSASSDSVYNGASLCATAISARYAGSVNLELDGALKADYSDLSSKYSKLATMLQSTGKRLEGGSLGLFVGGLPSVTEDSYTFYRGQFSNQD